MLNITEPDLWLNSPDPYIKILLFTLQHVQLYSHQAVIR